MNKIASLVFFLFTVMLTFNSFATGYYVSSVNGNDLFAGTQDKPFATIAKAGGLVNPGDTVFVMNGVYSSTNGPVLNLLRSGTPSQYITIQAFPGHHPKITASGNVWNAMIIDASYITIDGFELEGNNANIAYSDAYQAYQDYKNGVKGPQANFNTNAITFGSTVRVSHVKILNCNVHDFPGGGISGSLCDYITVAGNTVFNNAWYMMYAGSGISILNPSQADSSAGYKIFIRNNICYGNKTTIPWTQINALSDGNGIIIDVNLGSGTGATAVAPYAGRTLVENNISYNNGGGGIHAYKSAHVDIINNTAYNNGTIVGYPEMDGLNGYDVNIYNNIMYARTGGACNLNNTAATYNFNLYFNGPSYRQGTYDLVAYDPQFVFPALDGTSDFQLTNSSPAINTGSSIPGQFSTIDILGLSRPIGSRADMGAYEFNSTPAAVPGFTPGNIAVLTVGDGATPLGTNASPVTISEYTPAGARGAMNVIVGNASTLSPNRLLLSGDNSTAEGQLNLSSDGRYLTVAGYEAGVGAAAATYKANEKVLARINYDGSVDYSTRIPAASMNGTVRCVVTGTGTRFYVTGTSTSPASGNSTRFQAFGTTITPIAFAGSLRSLSIFNNQVYFANNNTVGSLTPDPNAGNYGSSVSFPGVNATGHNYQGIALLDLDPTIGYLATGYDVLYCADPALGLVKFYWNGSSWILAGTYNPPSSYGVPGGLYALTARITTDGSVQIFVVKGAASNNEIIRVTDTGGLSGSFTTTALSSISIATAGANFTFRGIAGTPSLLAITLPADLLSFKAFLMHSGIQLNWATTETELKEFIVERSTDAASFKTVAIITAKAGANGNSYAFTDNEKLTGKFFYRLKSVNTNGSFKYSRIVTITVDEMKHTQLKLVPNPVTSYCSISYPVASAQATMIIVNAGGKKMGDYIIATGSSQRSIDVSGLTSGLYFIIYQNDHQTISASFVK